MASLVVRAMEQGGVKTLMGCVPKCIEKDEKSGQLKVKWMTSSNDMNADLFDTVIVAAGKLMLSLLHSTSVVCKCS